MKISFLLIILCILNQFAPSRCNQSDDEHNPRPAEAPQLSNSLPLESSPMVSAVLLECPKDAKTGQAAAEGAATQQPECEEQLMVNIRVNPSFHIERVEKFLILDEVYDPRRRSKAKILSPYLIEISRGEPVMMYPLEFSKSVKCDNCSAQNGATNPISKPASHVGGAYSSGVGGESNPQQDSMDRVVQKLVNAFRPANEPGDKARARPGEDAPGGSFRNTQYQMCAEGNQEDARLGPQQKAATAQHQIVRPMGVNDAISLSPRSDSRRSNQGLGVRGVREDQANVGIGGQMLKQLQASGKLAQLGLMKLSDLPNHALDDGALLNREVDSRSASTDKRNMEESEYDADYDEALSDLATGQQADDNYQWALVDGDEPAREEEPAVLMLRRLRRIRLRKGKGRSHAFPHHGRSSYGQRQLGQLNRRPNLPENLKSCQCASGVEAKNKPADELSDWQLDDASDDYAYADDTESYKKSARENVRRVNGNYLNSMDDVSDSEPDQFVSIGGNDRQQLASIVGPPTRREKSWMQEGVNRDTQRRTDSTDTLSEEQSEANEDDAAAADDETEDDMADDDRDGADAPNEQAFRHKGAKPRPSHNGNQPHIYGDSTHRPTNYEAERRFPAYRKFRPAWTGGARWQAQQRVGPARGQARNELDEDVRFEKFDKPMDDSNTEDLDNSEDEAAAGDYDEAAVEMESAQAEKDALDSLDYSDDLYNNPGIVLIPSTFQQSDTTKKSKIDALTHPQLDVINPVGVLKSLYKDRPFRRPYNSNSNRNYYAQSLDPVSRELYSEHGEYLPKLPPYGAVLNDPNLSLSDKLPLLDFLDPADDKSDRELNQLTQEVDKSFLARPIPYPVPIPIGSLSTADAAPAATVSSFNRPAESNKRKRSFLMYDDLEMRETLDDSDSGVEARRPQPGYTIQMDEDVQPCATCGGKGKKPPKPESAVQGSAANGCACRVVPRSPCDCAAKEAARGGGVKAIRSVSDAWFAVFNMSAPLPFLTTKLRIFRKRHNTWWQVVPSITLNSLSGIFANANLSILFSSHVDIFQLEKALRLQDHQLIIPKDNKPLPPAPTDASSRKSSANSIKEPRASHGPPMDLQQLSADPSSYIVVDGKADELCSQLREYQLLQQIDYETGQQKRGAEPLHAEGVRAVGELGYFPTSMNMLEQCPYDKNRLCLNMLDDKVPAYSIKVKLPFRENALVSHNVTRVKISSIIADATTKDVLQIAVDVINEGVEAQEFSIVIANCPTGCATAAKTTVRRLLLPRLGETVTFLLPLIMEVNQRHKRFSCDVLIKAAMKPTVPPPTKSRHKKAAKTTRAASADNQTRIVATRKLVASSDSRCFCVWECNCHCVEELETRVDFNVCQKLRESEVEKAGLQLHCQPGGGGGDSCRMLAVDDVATADGGVDDGAVDSEMRRSFYDFLHYALLLVLVMLLLGLLKALVGGLCWTRLDSCGYRYVQPGRRYEHSSRCRRFLANTVFFVVFPFVFCCKCFTPSEEDLLIASAEWECVPGSDHESQASKSGDEDVLLSQTIDVEQPNTNGNRKRRRRFARLCGGEDVFDMDNNGIADLELAFNEGIFDDDDDDEELNTRFILQALVESRESLKRLADGNSPTMPSKIASLQLREHSSQLVNCVGDDAENVRLREADALVQSLKQAQIVYRVLEKPVGGVHNMPPGVRYCIQGYFLPALGREYEFVNYNPLAQYIGVAANGQSMEPLRPPVILRPNAFARTYAGKLAVLEAGDLHTEQPMDAPCLNVTQVAAVASSMAKLASSYRAELDVTTPDDTPISLREHILSETHAQELDHWQDHLLPLQVLIEAEDAPLPPETSSNTHTTTHTGYTGECECGYEEEQFDEEELLGEEELAEEEEENLMQFIDDRTWSRFRCDTIPE